MKIKVLISCVQLQSKIDCYRNQFDRHDIEIALPTVAQQLTENQLLAIIDNFDGVIAGDDEFTEQVLQKASKLKVISRWGIGIDGINLTAADRLGIKIFNTPDVFADEVGDVVTGYIVLLARQLHRLDSSVRTGAWAKIQGISVRNKVLGIIGLGSIGRAVAQRGIAMGMEILGYDIKPVPKDLLPETGVNQVNLDELIRESDFISLNCNLTEDNRHMLGQVEFNSMKKGVYLINTARGPLIDEMALVNALTDGTVAGAALDVYEIEPLPTNSPLRKFEQCIFGTHNSSNTLEAVNLVNQIAIDNLFMGLQIVS